MRKRVITIRHHGMRHVHEEAVDAALDEAYGGSPSFIDRQIDTDQFALEQGGVNWDSLHESIWKFACDLKDLFKEHPGSRITYFGGFPEVASVIALGAYLGEEWNVDAFDLRGSNDWRWPRTERTLSVEVEGLPDKRESFAGPASLRIEMSAPVSESHVETFVPSKQSAAAIRIGPANRLPQYGDLVQSARDVTEVREAVRTALASLLSLRPNVTELHVFVAGPPSIALAVGQELRLRNGLPIYTYRHRATANGPTMAQALLIAPTGPTEAELPLSEEQLQRASDIRQRVWARAVRDLESYSASKEQDKRDNERWYERLLIRGDLARIRPFPPLPPVYEVIASHSEVDPIPLEPPDDYAYSRGVWRINDRLLIALDAGLKDDESILQSIRMFMLHEASHRQHSIVKGKADEVGKFPNSLEHADFTADLYAILHELDRSLKDNADLLTNFLALRRKVDALIDLIVRSFWAFEPQPPLLRIETRRLRRHLNWYWQQARVQRCETSLQLFAALCRQPVIEIAGMEQSVVSRRVYASLTRYDKDVHLELGLILDNEELWRVKDSATVPLRNLIGAFRMRDHETIQKQFGRIFEDVAGSKHALPDVSYFLR